MLQKRWLWVLLYAGGWLLASGIAEAALSVSPGRVVIRGRPAQKLTGDFHATNNGNAPIDVAIEIEDWAGGVYGARGAVPWLKINPQSFTLKPGKSKAVRYILRVPKDAAGELRAQVFFSSAVPGAEGSVSSRLGSILYLAIVGTEHVDGAIEQVAAEYVHATPGVARPDRLNVAIQIRNRGNVHLIPEGGMVLKDLQGQVLAMLTLPAGWGLLPGQSDTYRSSGYGVYIKPGRYTLAVTIRGGADVQQPITLEKTFSATLSPDFQWSLEEPLPAAP